MSEETFKLTESSFLIIATSWKNVSLNSISFYLLESETNERFWYYERGHEGKRSCFSWHVQTKLLLRKQKLYQITYISWKISSNNALWSYILNTNPFKTTASSATACKTISYLIQPPRGCLIYSVVPQSYVFHKKIFGKSKWYPKWINQ